MYGRTHGRHDSLRVADTIMDRRRGPSIAKTATWTESRDALPATTFSPKDLAPRDLLCVSQVFLPILPYLSVATLGPYVTDGYECMPDFHRIAWTTRIDQPNNTLSL
jgi:hypothetical protein